MSILQALTLGLIQGLTEFLPVSSSGHLVLAEHMLNVPMTDDITFEVFLHFGTLLSVMIVFWKDITGITLAIVRAFIPFRLGREYYRSSEHFRLGIFILLGSLPAGFVGLKYESQIGGAFADPKLVAVMLVVTGLLLFLTRLAKPIEGKQMGPVSAFAIGIAQAIAITPGISRSGSTISTAMYLGFSPVLAARFSFLLSLPAVAGATLLKAKEMFEVGAVSSGVVPLLVGMLVAFVSGYASIKFLLKLLERGRMSWFAVYCLIVGALGILFI